MGLADDLLAMQQQLAADRWQWEAAWKDCVAVAMPYASYLYEYGGAGSRAAISAAQDLRGLANGPKSVERSRDLYDATAAWAAERLTAGMESLITPRAQKWHGFAIDDPFAREATDVEEEYLDKLRDYHFQARYDSKSNFALSMQKALKGTVVLGTAVRFIDENIGRRGVDPVKVPFFYRACPLIENYMGVDAYDDVDRNCRVFTMSARAAVTWFEKELGGSVSDKLREKANDPKRQDEQVAIMHTVFPADEAREGQGARNGMMYASYWIEVDTKHILRDHGYWSFPYSITWWDQAEGSAYGQSPVMVQLGDIKMLQVMNKDAVAASQQMVKPPLATRPGIYNERLNLNPGAVNPGYIDGAGRLLAQPIITNQNPQFAERILEQKRNSVREGLYVNLFQILIDNPQMSATEALLRANEKGELLGPAGAKLESGVARGIDREVDIVARKGAFEPGSPLEPPETMGGKNIGVKFTGPLARLRRMQELQGVQMVMELAGGLAQYDQSVIARIDPDESLEIGREISGAPRKMFRTDEEVAAIREQEAQALETQAALGVAQQVASAAKDAAPAAEAMQRMQAA